MGGAEESPAYQWYPKDYLSSTPVMMMSLAQEGAYRRLLDYQWLNGWVPDCISDLARLCRITPREMEKLWPGLAPCFGPHPSGTGLANPRLEKEREKQRAYRDKMTKAGKAGAAARWTESDRNEEEPKPQTDRNAIAREPQCDSMPLQFASSSPSAIATPVTKKEELLAPPSAPAEAPPASREVPILVYPCIPGKKSKGDEWGLLPAQLAEWEATYPAVNVPQQLREALAWVKAKPTNRKTYDGMPAYLNAWLGREQDKADRGPTNGRQAQLDIRRTAGDQQTHVPRKGGFRAFPDEERQPS